MARQTPVQRLANEKFARNEERKKGKSAAAAAKYSRGKQTEEVGSASKLPWAFIIFIGVILLGQAFFSK